MGNCRDGTASNKDQRTYNAGMSCEWRWDAGVVGKGKKYVDGVGLVSKG